MFLCDRAKEVVLREFIDNLAAQERLGAITPEQLLCGELPGGMALPIANGIETIMVA